MARPLDLLASVLGLLAAASVAHAERPLRWTEDVRLPDGRVLVADRYTEFKGSHYLFQEPTESDYWVEFEHPDTKKRVRWASDRGLQVFALSIVASVTELLVVPDYEGTILYNCPEPFLLAFRYVDGAWVRISLVELRQKVLTPNLTQHASASLDAIKGSNLHLTADQIQKLRPLLQRGTVIDLSNVGEQSFGSGCHNPVNLMLRKDVGT